jgi:flagellar assembly protein FliH
MGRILKAKDIEANGGPTLCRLEAHTMISPAPVVGASSLQSTLLQASSLRADALQSGLAEDFARALNVLREVADRLAEHEQRLVERDGQRLIDLAVAVARRIVRAQVELDPAVVQRAAREALGEAGHAQQVQVRVNPRDLPATQAISDALLEALESLRGLTVVPDPDVTPGGVVLQTDVGVVDGQIETQLAEVRAALVELDEAERATAREV